MKSVDEMHHPYLVGKNVYLRALEEDDLQGPMFDWPHDSEVVRYMYMGWIPNTQKTLRREYDALNETLPANLIQMPTLPENIVLAVIDKSAGKHIGNVGLYGINWLMRIAELRILLGDRDHWGQGKGFEAYRLILEYGFDRLNLRRIVAGARADNTGSIVLLKKVGFVQEGCEREHFLRNDQPYDILTFGLLRREFFALFSQEGQQSESNT